MSDDSGAGLTLRLFDAKAPALYRHSGAMTEDSTVREKIDGFPDRHPFPVRCVLFLAFFICPEVPWEAVHMILENMGYYRITLEKDMGSGVVSANATWTNPDEKALNIPEVME